MKIRILVAVDRDGRMHATRIYDVEHGMHDARECLWNYDIDESTIQWRIVEADVPGWQEPAVPVVRGETAAAGAGDPVREGEPQTLPPRETWPAHIRSRDEATAEPPASDGPGDGWRFVNVGERVERLDECYIDGEWRKASHCGHLTTAWYENLYRRRITPAAIIAAQEAEIRRLRLTDEEREAILLAVEHGENASSLGPLRPIWTLTLRRLLERTK